MIDYRVFSLSTMIDIMEETTVQNILNGFSCAADSDLESFLHNKAMRYEVENKGKTFIIIDKNKFESDKEVIVVAYYTLANTAIDLTDISNSKRKKVVGQSSKEVFPAFLIGQLGRDDNYTHEDLGGAVILEEAYNTLKQAVAVLGGKLVVLECREGMYEKVYASLGYKMLSEEPNDNGLFMLYRRADI